MAGIMSVTGGGSYDLVGIAASSFIKKVTYGWQRHLFRHFQSFTFT